MAGNSRRPTEQVRARGGYHVVHWSGHENVDALETALDEGEPAEERVSGKELVGLGLVYRVSARYRIPARYRVSGTGQVTATSAPAETRLVVCWWRRSMFHEEDRIVGKQCGLSPPSGWRVTVTFLGGDLDRPIVTGCVDVPASFRASATCGEERPIEVCSDRFEASGLVQKFLRGDRSYRTP